MNFIYRPTEKRLVAIELKGRKTDYQAGWITDFQNGKIKLLLVTGEEKEFGYDEKTDVLIGYMPKKDDFVYFKANEEGTMLTYLRYLSHPEKLESSELYKTVQELAKQRKENEKSTEQTTTEGSGSGNTEPTTQN